MIFMGSPNRNFFAFLQQCMDQNLEHARHVENERLAFTGIYITITTAYLSFGILEVLGKAIDDLLSMADQ